MSLFPIPIKHRNNGILMLKLSIVVPCYNVREYIDECMASILRAVRNMENLELVVVDDGSTDSTLMALRRWAKKFPSFKLIESENLGVSGARNLGLEAAEGEYVLFIDADDKINHKNFAILYDELHVVKSDLVCMPFFWWEGHHSWETGFVTLPEKKVITDQQQAMVSLFKDQQFYLWSKVIRRSILQSVEFPVGKHFEDVAMVPDLYAKCESFYYLRVPLVYYRQRPGSILSSKKEESIFDFMNCYDHLAHHKEGGGAVKFSINSFYIQVYIWCINDCFDSENISKKDKSAVVKDIRSIFKKNMNGEFFDTIKELFSRRQRKLVFKALVSYCMPRFFFFGRRCKNYIKP